MCSCTASGVHLISAGSLYLLHVFLIQISQFSQFNFRIEAIKLSGLLGIKITQENITSMHCIYEWVYS